jgi:hypothetical protein
MAGDRIAPTCPTLLGRLRRVPADQAGRGELTESSSYWPQ